MVTRVPVTIAEKTADGRKTYSAFLLTSAGRVAITPYLLSRDFGTEPDPTVPLPLALWESPFAHDAFMNLAFGPGVSYKSTGDPQHVHLFSSAVWQVNGAPDWSDSIYLAEATDPQKSLRGVEYLPAGWGDLEPNDIGTFAGAGPENLDQRIDNAYVPEEATWHSNNNTDRKVHLIQPAVTFKTIAYPAGCLVFEVHKFYRTDNPAVIYSGSTNLRWNDLRLYGLNQGSIASGTSAMWGIYRRKSIVNAKNGDRHAFNHVAQIGLSNARLMMGPIWPARLQDGDAASRYTGMVPYGTHIALHPDIESLIETWTVGGNPATELQKATLQQFLDYGGVVGIRSGSGGTISIKHESTPPTDSAAALEMKAVLQSALSYFRIVNPTVLPSTPLDSFRMPTDRTLIGGGGSTAPLATDRRQPNRASL